MASHQLAIAKAAFAAGLLRPDPVSIPREEIAHFHTLLHAATTQCSSTNIQNCKRWVMRNILPSTARSASFGKYLAALSTSYVKQTRSVEPSTSEKRPTSARRQRLHILYLLNDVLHQGSVINHDASTPGKFQSSLVALFKSAAEFRNCPKNLRKINELLDLWEEKVYYASDYIEKLRETVKQATENSLEVGALGESHSSDVSLLAKPATSNAPFIMPAGHGDQSTPWYDLPAGNLMPHIVPNSTRPINPELIKPLQFVAGPADKTLADAVRILLEDVDSMFGEDQTYGKEDNKDVDELGQLIEVDRVGGDQIGGESYYGWSRTFCEKMKQRQSGQETSRIEDRGRGYSSDSSERGRSRSASRNSNRMRSESSNGSGYRKRRTSRPSRSRRRSPLSHSPTGEHSRGRNSRHSRSYSRSTSRSRSRSRSPQSERHQQTRNRSRSPFREQSRPLTTAPNTASNFNGTPFHPLQFIPPPGLQFDANGLHIPPPPPPPPPHHQGQWLPPPPPNMTPTIENFYNNQTYQHPSNQSNQPWANPQYTALEQWHAGGPPPSRLPGWPQPPQQQLQPVRNGRGGPSWSGTPSYHQQQYSDRGRGGYNSHRGGRGNYGGRGW